MNRSALLVLAFAFGCAPSQPEETDGCTSISDCPLTDVCDMQLGECIPEPEDRFLGSFICEVNSDEQGSSEVVGAIGVDRWVLPWVSCSLTSGGGAMLLVFSSPFANEQLMVFLDAAALADRTTTLRRSPGVDGLDWARMANDATCTAYGYSREGKLELSARPVEEKVVGGYLDFTVDRVSDEDIVYGELCPRGLADCGSRTWDCGVNGGAQFCSDFTDDDRDGPTCSRICTLDAECAEGGGVCVQGQCTKACINHDDCESPLRCIVGGAGESNGCF
jgi:hypothetical protein